jgi:hypothetical protein
MAYKFQSGSLLPGQLKRLVKFSIRFYIYHMTGTNLFFDFANLEYPSILNKVFSSIKILAIMGGIRIKKKNNTVAGHPSF